MREPKITPDKIEALARKMSDCIDYDQDAELAVLAAGTLVASLLETVSHEDPVLAQLWAARLARFVAAVTAGGSVQ